jgi:hypothetical protein
VSEDFLGLELRRDREDKIPRVFKDLRRLPPPLHNVSDIKYSMRIIGYSSGHSVRIQSYRYTCTAKVGRHTPYTSASDIYMLCPNIGLYLVLHLRKQDASVKLQICLWRLWRLCQDAKDVKD